MRSAVEPLLKNILHRVTNTELRSNTYLLADPTSNGDCVVVDAGLDRERIALALSQTAWRPRAVLCTHGHFDHIGGAAWLQQTYGIAVYLPRADIKLAKMSNFLMAAFKLKSRISLPDFSLLDDDGPIVDVAGRSFTYHALPGHTPGSAGIAVDGLLFSGDSLYAHHTGLSKLPGEDHERLRQSLRHLFSWIADDVLVLPGHGVAATVHDISANNAELRTFLELARPIENYPA